MTGPTTSPATGPRIARIDAVDPAAESDLRAWHEVMVAGEVHGREEWAAPRDFAEVREALRHASPGVAHEAWLAWSDGVPCAAAHLEYRLLDNLDRADSLVVVHPAHRRRGVGSSLLEAMVERARELGRSRLGGEAWWPLELPDGRGSEGADFLTRRGFELGVVEVVRVLDLPADPDLLARAEAEVAAASSGYRIESFAGAVPQEWAAGWARLTGSLDVEAPTGSIAVEAWDDGVAGLRADEELRERQGRSTIGAVALDPAGEVVAYTELVRTRHQPTRAFQYGTLVAPAHRGHRLGLAVKTAALRHLERIDDAARRIWTFNAEVNTPMIEVNERLGYRPVERAGWFERRI